ncbi:MAG TPA: DUF481 domain-containing protein [Puia sp.]|nr:DUF481 domain-containing protein [Puia sp.]
MKRVLGMLLFLPLPAMAQTIDPGDLARDSIRSRKSDADSTHHADTAHLHYNYSGTGTLNNTNSLRSLVLNNRLKLGLVEQSASFNFTNDWIYGKQNAVVTNNDFTSSLDGELYKTLKHFYYWAMANYTTSVSLLIHRQEQAGLGPGYNVIDKKKTALLVSDGVVYETGDLYDSVYGGSNGNRYQRDIYHTFRNSFHLLFHWVILDRYTVEGSGFWQNAFTNWADYNLRIYSSVSMKLHKGLAFTVAVAYDRFTRTQSTNTLFSFGLTYQR